MVNVVLSSPFREECRRIILEAGGDRCRFTELSQDTPEAEAKAAMAEAEVLIGFTSPALLAEAKKLKWMQMTWAGVDAIDSFVPRDLLLTNASGAFGPVISEYVMASLLSLARLLPTYIRQQTWQRQSRELTLEGKRALILGAGDIGGCVARRLRAFDVYNVGVRRVRRALPENFDEMVTLAELDEELPKADLVICSLPATAQTKGLLDERRLRLMKDSAILVNVGRGDLIDTKALEKVLAEGHLFGVGLDVTDPEPLPDDSPLWKMNNVVITPHTSGLGFGAISQTQVRVATICAENLRRYLAGEPVKNVVDRAAGYRATVMDA